MLEYFDKEENIWKRDYPETARKTHLKKRRIQTKTRIMKMTVKPSKGRRR